MAYVGGLNYARKANLGSGGTPGPTPTGGGTSLRYAKSQGGLGFIPSGANGEIPLLRADASVSSAPITRVILVQE